MSLPLLVINRLIFSNRFFVAVVPQLQYVSFFKDRFHRKQCVQYAWKSCLRDAVCADLYDLLRRDTDVESCICVYFQLRLATAQR